MSRTPCNAAADHQGATDPLLKTPALNPSDHISQKILQHDRVDVTARDKRAIAVSFCDEDAKPSTSAQAENETTHQVFQVHQAMASPLLPSPNSPDSWDL